MQSFNSPLVNVIQINVSRAAWGRIRHHLSLKLLLGPSSLLKWRLHREMCKNLHHGCLQFDKYLFFIYLKVINLHEELISITTLPQSQDTKALNGENLTFIYRARSKMILIFSTSTHLESLALSTLLTKLSHSIYIHCHVQYMLIKLCRSL